MARPPVLDPAAAGAAAALAGATLAVGALAVAGVPYALAGAAAAVPCWFAGRRAVTPALPPRPPAPLAAPVASGDPSFAEASAALEALAAATAGRLPEVVEARVRRIAGLVLELVPRLGRTGAAHEQVHAVVRTATDYLPEAVGAYLRLPRDFADHRPVVDGRTALAVLCEQLDLLAQHLDGLLAAVYHADVAALEVHGRFLAEKFADTALSAPPAAPGP